MLLQREYEERVRELTAQHLAQAYDIARSSSDRSNQNGAVIVNLIDDDFKIIGQGANNFPAGVEWTEERATTRPKKYQYYEHAERWAIYNAAYNGLTTNGAILICPWAACADCARAVIVAGIDTVIVHKQRMDTTPERWRASIDEAFQMWREAGVNLHQFDGPVDTGPIIANGEEWSPCR